MSKLHPIMNIGSLCTILFLSLFSFSAYSQQFDVALTKTTITNSTVKYGTIIPFNLTIYNQGTDTIGNVEIIDHYGDGYEFQNALNPDWNEHPIIVNAVNTIYTENIPPGQSRIITINLIAGPGNDRTDWINTVEIVDFTDRFGVSQEAADLDSSGDEDPDNDAGGLLGSNADNAINGSGTGGINDGVAATDEDDHDRDTIQIFDLALTKILDPITGYKYGDTLIFTTTVYNQGNIRNRIVRIRDIIPEGYINPVAENVAAGWSNDVDNPIFTFDAIEPFSQVEVDLKLILNTTQADGEAWINYAEIISAFSDNNGSIGAPLGSDTDADSQMASNSDGERSVGQGDPDDNNIGNTSVNPGDEDDHDPAEPEIFDLSLIKERATAVSSFNYGTPIDYSFTVTNQGNMAATDIIIVDSLPCGAMFEQSLNPSWTFDPVTRIATTTIAGPLEPLVSGNSDHIFRDTLILTVIGCFENQANAWTNYMEISQATNINGVQTVEIDGVFDSNFSNDPGGIPLTPTDNSTTGIGIIDEDNHDVELLQVYDLALKKELITTGPFTEGQDIDFRIRVYNQGNVVIKDLVVEDFIPEGYGFNLADNAALGWTTSYSTIVNGVSTVFTDTLNVMEDLFLAAEDSVDIMIRLQLEFDGMEISDWYNYAHIWVATDTIGNNRFDDADSNPFTTDTLEFEVIPGSINDNNIFSLGKSVTPQVEEDDHDVANVDYFDLTLSKTMTSSPTAYGQDVTFDIVVRNEGVQFAHDITVVDRLPCGLAFDAGNNTGWVANAITGDPEFFYTDTLFAGEEIIIPISLTIRECATSTTEDYRNVAEITDALNDDDVTGEDQDSTPDNENPNEDDQNDALVPVFDLSLEKTINTPPVPFAMGSTVIYDIIVTNEGNVPALNTIITDYIPCGLDFAAAGNTGWSANGGGDLEYTISTLINPGMSVTVPLTLTIGSCTGEPLDFGNVVEITDDADPDNMDVDDFDSTPGNIDPDEDDIDDAPLASFDLSLTKTLTTNTDMLTYGMDLNYTIEVNNEGSIPATSFTVTDEIPCGLSFAAADNAGWTLDAITGDVSFEYNTTTLDPGETIQLFLILTLEECANPTADSWNNSAEITEANDPNGPADDADSTLDNNDPNEDDQDDAPLQVGDLVLSKGHADPVGAVGLGTPVDYSITVTNQGNVSMVDFVVTDYIPCGLMFSPTGNTGWTAVGSNAEFTVTTPLAPGASTTIPLTLTIRECLPPSTPDYVNAAEISDQGPNPDDPDSTPDDDPDNDPPTEDDSDEDPLEFYDLSLVKSSTLSGNLKYGGTILYNITVTNEGSLSATNVAVTDYLPCGLRFDQELNPEWTFNSGTGNASTLYSGTILPGATYDFTLRLILEECSENLNTAYNNIAEITGGDDPTGNPGNDEDSTPNNQDPNEDDINNHAFDVFDLSLMKTVTSAQTVYLLGDEVTYIITVSNEGNLPASGFEITDYIPCGMMLSNINALPWNVGLDGYATYTYQGTVPPGSSVTFEIRLVNVACQDDTGQRTNVAEISNNGPGNPTDADSTPGNEDPNEDDIDDAIININVGSTIGDYVWNDADGDGIQDSNESGIPGISVTLYTAEGDEVATVTTDGSGFYEFEEVEQGDYFIEFTDLEDDQEPTITFAGNNDNDSNVTEENGSNTTSTFTVESGVSDNSIDAGFFVCSLIKGVSYYDENEDDIRQSTENGINGLVVNLYRRTNGVWTLWDSETTHHDYDTPSDDGIWDFCAAPGEYYIEVVMPPIGLVGVRPFIGGSNFDSDINGANGPNTTPTFTLSPGGSKTDLGAGYYPMATVGNSVWLDENFNGLQESNEAKVEGIIVQVYNMNHELVDEATTNSEGIYKVEYLKKEEYYLKFEAPDGYAFTFADAGFDEVDSDVNHAMGINTTSPRMFNPGEEVDFVDAGIVSGVLPVKWKDIGVTQEDNHHSIYWSTKQELNVENYSIERRLESEDKFEAIGEIIAHGNSNVEQRYNFEDFDTKYNGKYYYRIQQFDFDGISSYSDVVYVTNHVDSEFSVYPNPTIDEVTLKGKYTSNTKYTIKLISLNGQSSFEFNTVAQNNEININLSNIISGIYYLELYDENNVRSNRMKIFKK